jgi:hypothetical protein
MESKDEFLCKKRKSSFSINIDIKEFTESVFNRKAKDKPE